MISFSLKLLQGILKGSKRDKWAEYCTPEKIGEVATRKVRDWFDKKSTPDGTIGEISEDEMKQLAEVSPIATATMLVAALDAPRGASDERDQNLASYMRVLEPIAQTVRDLETSIALRGFLHDTECVSYWHLRDKQGSGDAFRKSGDHLVVRGGLEVYVFSMEPTDDALDALNVAIRSAASRQLPTSVYDYLVEEIHEQKVITTRRLDSDREAKREKAQSDPFGIIHDYNRPIEISWTIPSGVPGIVALLESLPIATRAQAKFTRDLAETLEKAKKK